LSASAQTAAPYVSCIVLFRNPLRAVRGRALQIRNRLLASLKREDLKLLGHLREIDIQQGDLLEDAGRPPDAVYFPQTGMISLIVQMPEDRAIEVGTIGSEGAVGITAGLGSRISFITAMVQVAGTSLCISASRFRAATGQSPRIRDLIVRHSEVQLGQIQQTAACNALHDDSARLCRWLFKSHQRCRMLASSILIEVTSSCLNGQS
jgi:CRP-like cAMP-binding protein